MYYELVKFLCCIIIIVHFATIVYGEIQIFKR